MLSLDDLVRNTAGVASRILNGESPVGLKLPPLLVGQPIFDWRELQRWGISESRLPPGSIVKYRRRTLWEDHKLPILITISALVLQSFLIVLLLFERRARQRAEVESRRNLALAADANRRETVSALTSSIGHELGQPLSAILHNAYALQMVLTSDRSTRGAAEQIVTDIKAAAALAGQIIERHRTMLRSHQLHRDPIDVHSVIDDTIALVAHDMRARQIETTLELSAIPCVIEGDHVLLQQVLVNLVRNAVDALAESSSARRQITIRSAVRGADVEISVRDNGTGLPEEIIGSLFTPFVTTKSHGLGIGLTIAQRIVEAHDGTIVAHENVDGGATFTVMLPRSVARDSSRPDDRARASEVSWASSESRTVSDLELR
jgi:signal transduction histidine kinase